MNVYLIGCSKNKASHRTEAINLYQGPLFKKAFAYANAKKGRSDRIYILSALHGLVLPYETIGPYNHTLNDLNDKEIRGWSMDVAYSLRKESLAFPETEVIATFLCGDNYCKHLVPLLEELGWSIERPLQGLAIGKALQWLSKNTPVKGGFL